MSTVTESPAGLAWVRADQRGVEIWMLAIRDWDTGHHRVDGEICIEARPWYCDRGRYIVKPELPLDPAEWWPRYYFSIDVAKSEVEAWLKGRKELKGQLYGPE